MMAKKRTGESELPAFSGGVPDLKAGVSEDGTPLHEVQFLECKIILKPDRFTSAKSFREYGKLVERAAEKNDIECTDKAAAPSAAGGEFAFQLKFKQRDELREKGLERAKRFFLDLQQIGHDWLSLGTTKTGIVYQPKGKPAASA